MTDHLWENERGAALLDRSKAGKGTRRRAEILLRKGRRSARSGAGIGATGISEELTPPTALRLLRKPGEGSGGMKFKAFKAAGLWLPVLVLLHVFWGALLGGWLVYGLLEGLVAHRLGRMMFTRAVPALAVVSVLALWITGLLDLRGPISVGGAMEHMPVSGDYDGNISWLVWQGCLSPAVAGYLVWAWGWDGAGMPRRSAFDANGGFRKPTRREMRDLRVFDGETKAPRKPLAYPVAPTEGSPAEPPAAPAEAPAEALSGAAAEPEFEPEPDWFGLPADEPAADDGKEDGRG